MSAQIGTEGVTAFITAAYAVRWILAVLVVIGMLGVIAGANHRADKAEQRAAAAESMLVLAQNEIADLKRHNRVLRAVAGRRRAPVVALPGRDETEASHG